MSRKWEYYTETLTGGPDGWVKDLDQLGQEGWELVQVDFTSFPHVAVLKRPADVSDDLGMGDLADRDLDKERR